MAGVPNTTNFGLQDVVNVLSPVSNGLQSCFNASVDAFFDPNYGGSGYGGAGTGTDRLSNFRNYGGSVKLQIGYNILNEGWMYIEGLGWSTQRDNTTADSLTTDTSDFEMYVRDVGAGRYALTRTFLSFDLTLIPASAICESAIIAIDVNTIYGSSHQSPTSVVGSQGPTLTIGDWDALTFGNIVCGIYEINTTGGGFSHQLRADGSTSLGYVEAKFGIDLEVVLLNSFHDRGNVAPTGLNKEGIAISKAGELASPPVLYVTFTI